MLNTKWNYQRQAPEKNGIGKTVPDQTKTIREIMLMHSRGMTGNISTKLPQYHTDEELETLQGIDVRKLDLVEINQEFDRMAESLEGKAKEIEAKKLQAQKDLEDKKEKELREKYFAEFQQNQSQKPGQA